MTSVEFEQLLSHCPGGQQICLRDALFDYFCGALKDSDRANRATKHFTDLLHDKFVAKSFLRRSA
jgi:hypothetical protein